jgi:hypothetical protein
VETQRILRETQEQLAPGYSRNAVVHHGRVDLDVQLIQKPVSLQDLTARIRDMLDRMA